MKKYPPYKWITRLRAYGKTFVSERQRRYLMARIKDGTIDPGYPHRTGRTQRGYMLQLTKGGYGAKNVNNEPGAHFPAHDTGQSRLNDLAGWRKMSATISSNINGAIRHARAKVAAFLKSK